MAYRGWVKNSFPPSQQVTVLTSPISKPTTRMMDAASLHCSGTTCHAIKRPLPIPLPLSPDPFLCWSMKQGAAKKMRELVVIWCFYCDLPLTIFINSMLSFKFNLFWHISLHRSIFHLPLTLVPCVALSNRALWKTVIIGLVLHLTWHHAFISQLIVKKWWVKNIVKIKSYQKLTVLFVVPCLIEQRIWVVAAARQK